MEKLDKHYLLYDSRYIAHPDRAIVYSVCDTLEEAKWEKRTCFPDAVIVVDEIEWISENECRTISSQIIEQ